MKDELTSSIGSPSLQPRATRTTPPTMAVQQATAATTCPYCRGDLAEAVDLACAGCGTTLHRSCWRECRTCPTAGCGTKSPLPPPLDRHVTSRQERARASAAFLGEGEAMAARASGTRDGGERFGTWAWLEEWSLLDPATRGVELARHVATLSFVGLPIVFAIFGSVMNAPSNVDMSLAGALEGAAWGIPAAFAATAYGFLQGVVGIRPTKLSNGGLMTLFSAMGVGFVAFLVTRSAAVGIAVGLSAALIGGRVFGFHVESED